MSPVKVVTSTWYWYVVFELLIVACTVSIHVLPLSSILYVESFFNNPSLDINVFLDSIFF